MHGASGFIARGLVEARSTEAGLVDRALTATRVRFRSLLDARIIALLIGATLALVVGRADAQGTMGQFPDPISTPQLTRLLERYMTIRPEQWTPIETAHDAYRAEFQALRDGDMQRVMDDMSKMGFGIPTRAVVEDLLRRSDRVLTRVRALDNRLFDQIAVDLDETQIRALQRVRQARDRHRNLSSMMTMWIGGGMPDLSEIALDMTLSPAQRQAVDAILLSYEPTLTRLTASLHEAGTKLMVGVVGAMEAAGLADADANELDGDPERMMEMMEIMEQAFASLAEESTKIASSIRDLNHRTRRQLVEALGAEDGRAFRGRFLARAYPQLAHGVGGGETLVTMALRREGLDESQRAAIEGLQRAHRIEEDRLVEELIKYTDEHESSDMGAAMRFDEQTHEDAQAQRAALEDRRTKMLETLHANLVAIVGPGMLPDADALAHLSGGFGTHLGHLDGDAIPTADLLDEIAVAEAAEDAPPIATTRDPYGRAPITVQELAAWVRRMDLDAETRGRLEAKHSAYLKEWEATLRPLNDAMVATHQRVWKPDAAPTQEQMRQANTEMQRQREAAIAAGHAVDRRFFASAGEVVGERGGVDWFALIALERALDDPELATAMHTVGIPGTGREWAVNVVSVLVSRDDDLDLLPIVDSVLDHHADALRRRTADVVTAARESRNVMQSMGAEYAAASEDPARAAELIRRVQERMAEANRAVTKATDARRDAIRAVLDEMRIVLPPERFAPIERAHRRAAWPEIYDSPANPLPHIEAALAMDDLDDEQRTAIQALLSDTSDAFDKSADRIAELSDAASHPPGTTDQMQAWMERYQRLERLQFERNEVASRAIRRLRATLSPEQAKRIPALARFDEAMRERRWYEAGP